MHAKNVAFFSIDVLVLIAAVQRLMLHFLNSVMLVALWQRKMASFLITQ